MKNKLISKILLSTCIVSLSTVTVFANVESKQSSLDSNISEYVERKFNIDNYLRENPEAKSTVSGEFQKYTYGNAPKEIKEQYQADCALINKAPNASDIILVPVSNTNSYNTESLKNTVIFYIFHNRTTGDIDIHGSDGSYYKANTKKDYVGYNYQSRGSAVYCAQIILNTLNYRLAVDGIFGSNTHSAVTNFQRSYGLQVDATVGPNTWNAMLRASGLY